MMIRNLYLMLEKQKYKISQPKIKAEFLDKHFHFANLSINFGVLVACTKLYKSLCWLVCWSVIPPLSWIPRRQGITALIKQNTADLVMFTTLFWPILVQSQNFK